MRTHCLPTSLASAGGDDAWNRLVKVTDPYAASTTMTYTADGRNAATTNVCANGPVDSYYDLSWRQIESDQGGGCCGSSSVASQYVWGLT